MPRESRLTLDMMETFITVVECGGNASLAALRLNINQPSMSKRLSVLQHSNEDVRFPLLERHGKEWRMTEEGQRNLTAIKQIVRLAQALQSDQRDRIQMLPNVSVACGEAAAASFVLDAVQEFRRSSGGKTMRVGTMPGAQRIIGVSNGVYDFAIVARRREEISQIAQRELYMEQIYEDPWVLICGDQAPEPMRSQFRSLVDGKVTLQDLDCIPLIVPEDDAGLKAELAGGANANDDPHPSRINYLLEGGSWSVVVNYVRAGLGVGIIGQSAVVGATQLMRPKRFAENSLRVPKNRLICRRKLESDAPDLTEDAERMWNIVKRHAENLVSEANRRIPAPSIGDGSRKSKSRPKP